MTTKNRLAKLENASQSVKTESRHFRQVVRLEGDHKYYIDGVEVNAAEYWRAYSQSHGDEKINVKILESES